MENFIVRLAFFFIVMCFLIFKQQMFLPILNFVQKNTFHSFFQLKIKKKRCKETS